MADPDPRPRKRIIDKTAWRRKLLADPLCRACLARAVNTHHLVGRGQGGDDDVDNLIPLCGSGSAGCHGALHGNTYEDRAGRRWAARDVRQAIGLGLRPSEYHYAADRLTAPRAAVLLESHYYARVETLAPFRMAAVV